MEAIRIGHGSDSPCLQRKVPSPREPWPEALSEPSCEEKGSSEASHESKCHLKVHMKLQMNLFIHMKVHMKVQKRLRVRVHEGWGPSSFNWDNQLLFQWVTCSLWSHLTFFSKVPPLIRYQQIFRGIWEIMSSLFFCWKIVCHSQTV